MEVYRLSREKFAGTLSGKGAATKGARWNSVGVELIYTAANRSLAMAEVAVHFTLATLPDDYVMVTIFIPGSISLQKRGMHPTR
jgi:RES domain-containing protein